MSVRPAQPEGRGAHETPAKKKQGGLRILKEKAVSSRSMINRDFRAPCLVFAAVLCVAAVIFARPGIAALFDRDAAELYRALLSLDYIDDSAQKSWMFVRGLIRVLALVVPLLTGVGLWLLLIATFVRPSGKFPVWGLEYFSRSARIVRVIVYAVGILLGVLFLARATAYIVINGAQIGGILFIFAMLLPECVFLAVVVILFVLVLRGIRSAIDTADTILLNVLTGKNESYGLTVGAVWLIAMMGIAAAVLCVSSEDIYAALCFGCAGLADFLLAIWLICYRRENGRKALERFRSENA